MIASANAYIDITHVVYPRDFSLTKLAMDKLKPGEILKIRLRHGKSLLKVPKSLEAAGHKIGYVTNNKDGTYMVLIEKAK